MKPNTSRSTAPDDAGGTSRPQERQTEAALKKTDLQMNLFRLEQSLRVMEYREAERAKALQVVAHELRKPVTLILMELELLRRKAPEGPNDRHGRLDVLERSAWKAERLIKDLARTSVGDQELFDVRLGPVDLHRLMEECLSDLSPRLSSSHIEFVTHVEEDVVVDGDPERLAQVIVNLVENALKFTPADGRIELSCMKQAGHAVIRVEDTGRGVGGIDPERLFRPFVQADPYGEGTGLGLYIAKRIITAHDGEIRCDRRDGRKGASFTVTIPLRRL